MLSNAEIKAVLSVLWYTHAIRSRYEEGALFEEDVMWKNNGGLFPNHSRYHSQKWEKMMGPADPTVRGRRINKASMAQARRNFEESYFEPVMFALALVDRIRRAVTEAVENNGASEDGEYEEKVGWKVWEDIASDPAVRERLAELARNCCNVDASSVQP
jgi:hypothetical protein